MCLLERPGLHSLEGSNAREVECKDVEGGGWSGFMIWSRSIRGELRHKNSQHLFFSSLFYKISSFINFIFILHDLPEKLLLST